MLGTGLKFRLWRWGLGRSPPLRTRGADAWPTSPPRGVPPRCRHDRGRPAPRPRPARPDDGRRGGGLLASSSGACWPSLIAAGLVAWGIGIVHRGYDYDEVQRAHSVWLASRGLRPYVDMFEVHPPYFVLLTPILPVLARPLRRAPGPAPLRRGGEPRLPGGLVALGPGTAARAGRWAWLGVAFVAFHPRVLDFLVEFRIDGWGYALAAWSLVAASSAGPSARWRFATFGACRASRRSCSAPSWRSCPPLVVGFELLAGRRRWREAVRAGAGIRLRAGDRGPGLRAVPGRERDRPRSHLPAAVPLPHAEQRPLGVSQRPAAAGRRDADSCSCRSSLGVARLGVRTSLRRRSIAEAYPPALGALAGDPGAAGGLSLQAVLRPLVPLRLGLRGRPRPVAGRPLAAARHAGVPRRLRGDDRRRRWGSRSSGSATARRRAMCARSAP